MLVPKHFRLVFSEGEPLILSLLKKHSRRLPKTEAFQVSSKLYKEILRLNEQVESMGHPPHLHLTYVHPYVKTGVFLRPDADPIQSGDLIGIYTGEYELVEEDISTGTAYAYDVAQEIALKPPEFLQVTQPQKPFTRKKEYSIQTNALNKGNFTRYINHSSLEPNVEAVISKFPDGRLEIILFARKIIHPGEQLLSNYGGQYWKALGIIPNDMTPDTYLLKRPSFRRVLHHHPPTFSPWKKNKLLPLRNVETILPPKLTRNSLVQKLIDHKAQMSSNSYKKYQDKIDAFEDIILERGLLRNFILSYPQTISLKTGEKPLPNNKFLGTLAGTLSLSPAKHSILLMQGTKTTLFLHLDPGNFFALLPQHPRKHNLNLRFHWNSEEKAFYFLVFTSRKIKPKEKLILPTLLFTARKGH